MNKPLRSKTMATWLALLGGALGAHRFYLHGWADRWGWLLTVPTLVGGYGALRLQALGQDDRLTWLLLPLLGLAIAVAMFTAIVYGLTSDERWDARHNAGQGSQPAGWLAVLGVIVALLLGATALMSAVAYGSHRLFEWQAQEAGTARR